MTDDPGLPPDSPRPPDSPGYRDDTRRGDLDGHTMEELGDYLDRDRTPRDESIESSPACQLALAGMARLREISWTALTEEAAGQSGRDERWIGRLLDTIKDEIASGREIPVTHPDAAIRLTLSEAAVRGLVRRAGDTLGGVVMGRCTLDGDVVTPGAPVRVDVTASLSYGLSAVDTATRLRERIAGALARHTELVVTSIDIEFDDVLDDGRRS